MDHSQVKQRYCTEPIETIIEPRTLDQVNREYADQAVRLGAAVAEDCLARAGMKASHVDLFITVSCTGVMIPSLDAHLANRFGFRSDVRRLPITELGCAAGAAALAYAADYLRAYPNATVLVVGVELPSLTFQRYDTSQANLDLLDPVWRRRRRPPSSRGDGAARGPRIARTESFLFPDSLDAMGFDLQTSGFHIVLSRDVPELIRKEVRGLVDGFLGTCRRAARGARRLHRASRRPEAPDFHRGRARASAVDTECSWHVLREYGNQSSVSVLFVLHEWLARACAAPGSPCGWSPRSGPGSAQTCPAALGVSRR